MADKLQPPKRKNPQVRTRVATPPPMLRSRAALGFSARAAGGKFMLQACTECEHIAWPPRDICPKCWSHEFLWREMSGKGEFLAETVLHTSTNVYFKDRMPWRIGTVKLDVGVPVLAHIHQDLREGNQVKLIARTDKSGQGVIMAMPLQETDNMQDDKQFRELSCDPKFRRVLVTDVRNEVGQAVVKSLLAAEAKIVFMGVSEGWKPFAGQEELLALPNTEVVPLNLTEGESVMEAAASIGHKTDILINTATHVRPGSPMGRKGMMTAKDEMEVNYFGLLRLLQHFGPVMRGRAADGDNSAACWVNLLSVYALSNWPEYGTTSASQAAALSLAQSSRGEFYGSGIKVLNAFSGPLEDEWYQPVSPPKVTPKKLASVVLQALQQGLEEAFVGDIANDVIKRWREDPAVLERELTQAME